MRSVKVEIGVGNVYMIHTTLTWSLHGLVCWDWIGSLLVLHACIVMPHLCVK